MSTQFSARKFPIPSLYFFLKSFYFYEVLVRLRYSHQTSVIQESEVNVPTTSAIISLKAQAKPVPDSGLFGMSISFRTH